MLVVGLLVVPNYVALVPILKIYAEIEMAGTFPAAWLAHIGFGMALAIYILRNYMETLPRTVIESAEIDGASHFQTFYRLILPMSVPALASFAILQFLWVWNDLWWHWSSSSLVRTRRSRWRPRSSSVSRARTGTWSRPAASSR